MVPAMDVKDFYSKAKVNESRDPNYPEIKSSAVCHQVSRRQGPMKCLLEPQAVWRVFPRQQMAFDFAKTYWQSVAVFAFEAEEFGREGQRKYLVTTYYELGQRYFSMDPRHYYEVITEGSACHLYFDIEFKLDYNPNVEPLSLLVTFIEYVCHQLLLHFGVLCDRSNILDLDSSTQMKFSRHLVYHLPRAVFRNNIHAGNFIHYICARLRELKQASDEGSIIQPCFEQILGCSVSQSRSHPSADRLLSLFVVNERKETVLICDEGVYTKNRNFRLYLSSKLGKHVCLRVAKENKFKTSYSETISNRRRSHLFNTLMDSLVCNVRYDRSCKVLEFEAPGLNHKRQKRRRYASVPPSAAAEGYSHSPFPLVDQFITSSRLTRGGVQGSIRRWTYFPQGKTLVYDIQHNRWCENINRAHKSNNIMIIADLVRGVYYQKCHDPECRRNDFRSQEYIIPADCNPVKQSPPTQHEGPDPGGGDNGTAWVGDISQQALQELLVESLSDEEFLERTGAEIDVCDCHGGSTIASEPKRDVCSRHGGSLTAPEMDDKTDQDQGISDNNLDSLFDAAFTEYGTAECSVVTQHLQLNPPAVTQHLQLSPPAVTQHLQLNPPAVTQHLQLSPPAVTQHLQLSPPAVTQHLQLSPPAVTEHLQLGPPAVTQHLQLSPPAVTQHLQLNPPAVTQHLQLGPPAVTQHLQLGPPAVTQHLQLNPPAVTQHLQLGPPAVTEHLPLCDNGSSGIGSAELSSSSAIEESNLSAEELKWFCEN